MLRVLQFVVLLLMLLTKEGLLRQAWMVKMAGDLLTVNRV